MSKKAISFLHSSFLLTVDAGLAALFTGIFWLLAAHFIPAHAVGVASTVISAASLLALFSRLGFDYAIPYFYPKLPNQASFLYTAFSAALSMAIVISLAFLLTLLFWLPDLRFLIASFNWILAFTLLTTCLTLINLFLATAITSQKIPWVIAQDALQNIGRLLIWGSFIAMGRGLSAAALIFSSLLSALGSVILGYWKILPRFGSIFHFDRLVFSQTKNYALKSQGATLMTSGQGFFLPLLITQLIGAEDTAVFSVCWMILTAIYIIHTTFISLSFSEGSRNPSILAKRFPRLIFVNWAILTLILAVLIILGRPILHLFGQIYADRGYSLLICFTIGTYFSSLNDYAVMVHRVLNQQKQIYAFVASASLGVVIACFALLPGFGLQGVGYAYVAIHALISAISLIIDPIHPLKKLHSALS